MTDDGTTTPGELSEPVMDGAMDHVGPPPMVDHAGHPVDLGVPDDEAEAAEEADLEK